MWPVLQISCSMRSNSGCCFEGDLMSENPEALLMGQNSKYTRISFKIRYLINFNKSQNLVINIRLKQN